MKREYLKKNAEEWLSKNVNGHYTATPSEMADWFLSLTTEQVSDEEFLSACDEVRDEFSRYIMRNYPPSFNIELRAKIDSLIIMYDQMRDKLTNTKER